ncbi:MAG TPA: TrkH family potassium uptake protein [Planctomycetota bacterium]
MNLGRVSQVLAGFVAFFTLAQAVPLVLALWEPPAPRTSAPAGFIASITVGGITGLLLWAAGRGAQREFYRKETICVAGIAWFLASMLGAVPFVWSGLLPDPTNALFESVSGLTTCGATVLASAGNPTPEETAPSLLLWRAMLQWLGGIGIVLIFVALLPSMGAAGKSLLTAESVGVSMDSDQPRVLAQSRGVAAVYVFLTSACVLLLMYVGGMSFFDAVCQSFSTLATGGYSTRTSIALFDSLGAEIVLTVFMFLGGCSFTVMAASVRDGWTGIGGMLRTSEFRIYTLFTLLAVGGVTIDLVRGGLPFGTALRQSSFNVVSMLSCCGFATADFHAWPPLSLIVIFACTMVGGCTGSAAGGMKQVRLLVCLKLLAYTLRHFVRPKSVERLRLDGEVMEASTVSSILAMVLLWLLTILLGAMVIACDQRLSFVGALTASSSMLGNCGPALAAVHPDALANGIPDIGVGVRVVGPNFGPLGGYGDLSGWTKLVMSFEMILGRLELLTLLALFTPSFWRR